MPHFSFIFVLFHASETLGVGEVVGRVAYWACLWDMDLWLDYSIRLIHFLAAKAIFSSEGHVALDRNLGAGYNTLLLLLIPGDLLSACPHRQFHTLPGLLDSLTALSNSNPNALHAMQGGSLYHFYDGLWYDPAWTRTHDLPCERRTC